jgi:hypothetical protein
MRKRRTLPDGSPGFREGVEVVLIEGATRLLTIAMGDPMTDVRGAIVRFIPKASDSPEDRASIRAMILRAGARHVWVAPSESAPSVVNERAAQVEVTPEESPRVVVERMVEEAHTRDRDLLRQVVDEKLARANL